ncbi:MAG: cephalosporin hydroxylase [Gemmatimonadales bacterium]|mgnify:CR=1 FL=1|nr:cephalosporin hydroxylase [Gemmatimonadales bacterium]
MRCARRAWHGTARVVQVGEYERFRAECDEEVAAQGADDEFSERTRVWTERAMEHRYSYHFEWLGRPIIQFPQDVVAVQEIVWALQPDLVIETGIAHGGSLVLSASLLELNASCGGPPDAQVVGVDIDIRAHNRSAILNHPLASRIRMIEGSSTDPAVFAQIADMASAVDNVMVCLDSNHTHAHVLDELEIYAPMVSIGSFCIVFDTLIEELSEEYLASTDRPWRPGDSPGSAVDAYLAGSGAGRYVVDRSVTDRLMVTAAPGGYLRRIA